MAEAEGGHRRRLEARMTELGIPIPDPATVRISLWLRLQARIAPVDRLLAAREAAENDEVTDLYKRPTGDEETDRLLREIRKDERSHSRAVQEMRSGAGERDPSPLAPPGVQARLDRILGRETGLAAVFGIVTGVSGATGGSSFVLTAGLAGAVASALSMATGAFLAERSEAEVMEANVERERQEITEHPEEEREELSLFYQLKGIDADTADQLAERLAQDPDAMLKTLSVEEFGASEHAGNPVQASLAAGLSTGALVAHFLVGAAKSLVTLRSWWSAGLEMTLAGVIVGGATYLVGLAFPT
jgi:VIT1/CCC1 family predicted Fe2+/Mn2+ transporter